METFTIYNAFVLWNKVAAGLRSTDYIHYASSLFGNHPETVYSLWLEVLFAICFKTTMSPDGSKSEILTISIPCLRINYLPFQFDLQTMWSLLINFPLFRLATKPISPHFLNIFCRWTAFKWCANISKPHCTIGVIWANSLIPRVR